MWSKFDNVTPVLGIDFRQIDQNLRKLVPQRIIFSKIGIFKVMFWNKVFDKVQVSSKWLQTIKMRDRNI